MAIFRVLRWLVVTAALLPGCTQRGEWYDASRESAGIAPDPAATREAVLHVYGADAWGWRGWVAIHTWIAIKRRDEQFYTVYDVVGWRGFHGQGVLAIRPDIPDRYWYGARPELLQSHQGPAVEELIDAVDAAARAYPWKHSYKAFPGPNSNTFTAWVAQEVPQLDLDLPWSAIGSGFA
ncbi:MAG: DUF3750 domain-containing protein, partial [Gammaproteobacteria bacterium]|nr:DUF3750 domain-containing protein [Gammaproteobacteria bacterium]